MPGLLSRLGHHPAPQTGPIPKCFPGIRSCSRTPGPWERSQQSKMCPGLGALGWLFDKRQQGWTSITSVLTPGSATSPVGREPFISPLEIKKRSIKRLVFMNIFLQKFSGFPSLPCLLPIILRGGGRARRRERLAGFCFQFAQTDFFLCVFSLSGNSLQTGTSCRNRHFSREKYLANTFCPFWFSPGLQNPGLGLLRVPGPVTHQPRPAPCSHASPACPICCPAHHLPVLSHCSRGAQTGFVWLQ